MAEIIDDNSKYIFIISHMRSYSSLLSHILGSNPEISGYLEMHQSYYDWLDLEVLKQKLIDAPFRCPLNAKYFLDKILHSHLRMSGEIISKDNVRLILLLRNPTDTFKSIVNLT